MAEEWIKWVKGLSRRREVLAMASATRKDRKVIACTCMEVWEWADENTTDGVVPGVTAKDIDREAGMRGFAKAMEAVGWIKIGDGSVQFPHWDRHNGMSAKKRATDAQRQREARSKCHTNTVTVSQNICDKSVTRPDQTREEEKREDPAQPITPLRASPPDHALRLRREPDGQDGGTGGGVAREGEVDWAGLPFVRDALVALHVWPVVIDDVVAWEPPATLEEVRRVWEWVCGDRGVRDRQAVFVHRLYDQRGILDSLPRDSRNQAWEAKRARIMARYFKTKAAEARSGSGGRA